jgi:small subunit ribosomal protein S20
MPHTHSATKRLRQNVKRRARNIATTRAIKKQIKKVLEVAKTGSVDQLRQEYNVAAKKLDKAASRRVVHPNMAARKKSQLARLLNTKQSAKATA